MPFAILHMYTLALPVEMVRSDVAGLDSLLVAAGAEDLRQQALLMGSRKTRTVTSFDLSDSKIQMHLG
jgi:hypothetical protein